MAELPINELGSVNQLIQLSLFSEYGAFVHGKRYRWLQCPACLMGCWHERIDPHVYVCLCGHRRGG